MKLGPYLYLLNTFNIPKNEVFNEWAGWGRNQKTTKNAIRTSKTSLENAKEMEIFLTAIHNHQTLA